MENPKAPDLRGAVDIEKKLLFKQLTEMQASLLSWQAVALLALLELDNPIILDQEFVKLIMAGKVEVNIEKGEEENTLIYEARMKPEKEEDVEVEVPTFDSEPDSE